MTGTHYEINYSLYSSFLKHKMYKCNVIFFLIVSFKIQWIINDYLGLKVLNIYGCVLQNAHELWMNMRSREVHFYDLSIFISL